MIERPLNYGIIEELNIALRSDRDKTKTMPTVIQHGKA